MLENIPKTIILKVNKVTHFLSATKFLLDSFIYNKPVALFKGGKTMSTKKYPASKIAEWFLAYNRNIMAEEDAEYISNLKLQKLLYYAQGTYLAITGHELFKEPILAWKHGPVVNSVYQEYKGNKANGIVYEKPFDFNEFDPETENILEEVYDCFGQYSAWKLRNMTHSEEPWISTDINEVISNDKIKDYFKREYIE